MFRFLGTDLWDGLLRVGKAPGAKRVAVAYYTADSHVRCGRGDTLIVDASKRAIQTRQTSPTVLLAAARRGTKIYSHPKLHAKVILTKDSAIVGSANLSATSHSLREAGVLFGDRRELRRLARYLDRLEREARELSQSDLKALGDLPLEPTQRSPAGPRKRSLLEAIDSELPSLEDVSLNWYTNDVELAERAVRSAARQRRVYLPADNEWTWLESPNTPGSLSKTIRLCRDRPLVAWRVDLDALGSVQRFRPHEPRASAFIDAFVFQRRVVSIVGQRAFATSFDLRRDRKRLAEILSVGLARAPKRLRDAVNNDVGVIGAHQVIELYKLGSKKGTA